MSSKSSTRASFQYEPQEEVLDVKPQGTKLHIGIPKETAFQENRIALTPDAVGVLVMNGNRVSVEHNAGEASHFSDHDYAEAGATIVRHAADTNEPDHYFTGSFFSLEEGIDHTDDGEAGDCFEF